MVLLCGRAYAQQSTDHRDIQRPNIVYILVDDMGYGDLSVTGQVHFETPNIDAMAADGLLFTDAYAGSTVCAPSRASLFAGQHTGNVWQRGNAGDIQFREDPHDITVASLLKNEGYETALIGKSGLSCNSEDGGLPNRKGFDHFVGMTSHRRAHRHYPEWIWKNGERMDLAGNHGKTGRLYVSEVFTQEALDWIDGRSGDRPFFLHLALTPPHADLVAPDEFTSAYADRFDEMPHDAGGYYKQRQPKAAYAAMMSFIDDALGRVIDKLEQQGLAENTVVFFTSDNGPSSEGGKRSDELDSNGPFRGQKRDLYEGGIRLPLIVLWPGTIEPGRTSDLPTAMWDFLPTAVELARGTVPDWTDGISIVPTLLGNVGEQRKHEYLYWEFYERGGSQAVRMGQWKGVRLNAIRNTNTPIELYRLDRDPGETRDVSAEHPDIVDQMRRIMRDAHTPSPVFSMAKGVDRSALPLPRERLLPAAQTVPREMWRVADVSSENARPGRPGPLAFDGRPRSWWHTEFQPAKPAHPHHLTIDLGEPTTIAGFRYLPRQDGSDNGSIGRYSVYLSETLERGGPITEGAFDASKRQKEVRFERPMTGRYFTIVAHSCVAGTPFTSIAELDLLAVGTGAPSGADTTGVP